MTEKKKNISYDKLWDHWEDFPNHVEILISNVLLSRVKLFISKICFFWFQDDIIMSPFYTLFPWLVLTIFIVNFYLLTFIFHTHIYWRRKAVPNYICMRYFWCTTTFICIIVGVFMYVCIYLGSRTTSPEENCLPTLSKALNPNPSPSPNRVHFSSLTIVRRPFIYIR